MDGANGSLLREREVEVWGGELNDVRTWLRSSGEKEKGDYKHQTWQGKEQWNHELNKSSPNSDPTLPIPSYPLQLRTPRVYMRQTLRMGYESAVHRKQHSPESGINKVRRLVEKALLLATGHAFCVCYMSAGHICMRRISGGDACIFGWNLHIEPRERQMPSWAAWAKRARLSNPLIIIKVYFSGFMEKVERWPKLRKTWTCLSGFCLYYQPCVPRLQSVGVSYPRLPESASCSQLSQVAIEEYWDVAPCNKWCKHTPVKCTHKQPQFS